MTFSLTNHTPHPLWEGEPPGLNEADPVHVPAVTPYLVDSREPVGAVIVCPGGGYGHRAPHEGEPIAQWLNSLGIAAFVCAYRVAPYRHPYPSLDAARAVQWVRSQAPALGIKPDRVGLLGFSAGGHLVSTVGTRFTKGDPQAADPVARHSSRPDALVLCYPVISFVQYAHLGSARNLLGEDPSPEELAAFSSELNVTSETPPSFLWHTADDAGVPVQNSLLFARALAEAGVPFALHVFPHGRHGLGLAPEAPEVAVWADLCGQWLRQLGF